MMVCGCTALQRRQEHMVENAVNKTSGGILAYSAGAPSSVTEAQFSAVMQSAPLSSFRVLYVGGGGVSLL